MNTKEIIKQTVFWLRSFIIEYNICPFARQEYERGSIHYAVINSNNTKQCLQLVFEECISLDAKTEIETTLIIFPDLFTQFEDFLDFLALAESLLIEQNYEGIYQLASFHPYYCFEGISPMDPANYTNRSPYPMLHLIRESSLEQALQSFPHPEKIPERNIILTRQMGQKKLQAILNNSYKPKTEE
jgi:hypothetical protein